MAGEWHSAAQKSMFSAVFVSLDHMPWLDKKDTTQVCLALEIARQIDGGRQDIATLAPVLAQIMTDLGGKRPVRETKTTPPLDYAEADYPPSVLR